MTANHKFIQITLILFTVFESLLLTLPFATQKKKIQSLYDPEANPEKQLIPPFLKKITRIACQLLAIFIFFFRISTGVEEWIIYKNINQNFVSMQIDSEKTKWIEENTQAKTIFLTAAYSMDSFFLSGRFTYFGHSYYAWSAGHDTFKRQETYNYLLTGCDNQYEEFLTLCRQENIQYVLIDQILRNQTPPINEEFFHRNLPIAASFPQEKDTVIYKVPV